ncbi:MAG: peptidylprolyl isomerase [Brevundimonas sp.]|uniref:peptidylprolyl isomerase n=1 Tax=Brevundimonas sp. TaxID=1871086 RepID=UPI0025C2036D|nr:peptidylprolyl isomerase [Brevundimonas sp.]MBX3477705.1 peptidylprolyl isomerase [Brevundimonas sp.]
MIRRSLLGLAFLVTLAAPALAQETTTEAPPARVALDTSAGTIVIALDMKAPITAANFLRYVDERRLDGAEFYRALDLGAAGGLVQGGSNGDPARVLPPIAHEPTSQTGLSHVEGAVSMARFDPGTATGDFFIVVGPGLRSLDATAGDPGFAVFGRVVEGMEAVRAILASPRSPTAGEPGMVGQMLEPRIEIRSARRLD